ncbi:hypothetical protein D3C81_1676080 [compost metagenome]
MQARQRVGQRLGRNHHAITKGNAKAHQLADVLRHVSSVCVLLWDIDDVVVDLVNTPGIGEFFDVFDLPGRSGHVAALQDDGIRLAALQLDRVGGGVIQLPLDPPCALQLGKRLRYPIVPDRRGVDR